jgi:hypothetical protein
LGLLLVLVYFSPLVSHEQNVLVSVSDDVDNAAVEQPLQQSLPDNGTSSAAKDVYDIHEFNVGDGAQNLFILIPNEGHHGPQEDEDRFLDQPFIPQNAVLNKGTTIIWLNGDVGHEHNLAITNNSTGGSVYETGAFPEFEVRSLVLQEFSSGLPYS